MKHTILFLAANPGGTDQFTLDREARAIQVELERSGYGDRFEFQTRWAVQPLDLLRELRKLKPTVVHFSGYGGRGVAVEPRPGHAPRRDILGSEQSSGLFLLDLDGRPQFVSTAAIAKTFGAVGAPVKLVVLNACYTEVQAEALLVHVDCVVGMGGSIQNDAARTFALGFYGGLGEREPVAKAYEQGRAAIGLEGLPDADRPRLKVRAGVDAGRLVLAVPAVPPASPTDRTMRQVSAVNYAEQGVMIQGNQIVHMAPATTEQEQEARFGRLERERRRELDRLYLDDPMMKHRFSERLVLKVAGAAAAFVGVVALVLGQILFGITLLTGVGVGMRYMSKRSKSDGVGH